MKVNKVKISWSMFLVAFIMLAVNVLPTNAQDNVEPIIAKDLNVQKAIVYYDKEDYQKAYAILNELIAKEK